MSACTQCDGEGRWEEDVFSTSLGHGTVPRSCLHCEGTGEEPETPERCYYPDDVRREAMRRLVRRGRGWGITRLNAECSKVVRERSADHVWRRRCASDLHMIGLIHGVQRGGAHVDQAVTALHLAMALEEQA